MNTLLTIVVPAYNSEAYLNRCLDSLVVPEVMDKVQVLIMNDGSKDKTSEIAHEYQVKFPNTFVVIDKENGNYGSCMNLGLKMAAGKYFRSLDSDDWYDREGYVHFVEELEKTDADMVVCEKKDYHEADGSISNILFDDNVVTGKDESVRDELFSNYSVLRNIFVACVSYKTSLLCKIGFNWPEKIFYTDTEFVSIPLNYVQTIRFVKKPVYVYLRGREEQSMSETSMMRNFSSFYIVASDLINFYKIEENRLRVWNVKQHILKGHLLNLYYQMLYCNSDSLRRIILLDQELKTIDLKLYHQLGDLLVYYRLHYLRSYRSNLGRIVYKLARFIFKIKH